jgi:hypothetical protein
MQVHTSALQYCDNAATPVLQYAAYGDASGNTLTGDSATSFFSSGTIEDARLPASMADKVITGSLAIPQAAAPVVDATGELALDTTGASNPQLVYYDGTAARVVQELVTKTMVIETPAVADDFLFFRAERAITVVGIDCVVAAATSAQVTVNECDANGGTCAATEAVMTCGTTNTTEAVSIDDPAIDAGDWVRVDVGTVTGSVGHVAVSVTYRETRL